MIQGLDMVSCVPSMVTGPDLCFKAWIRNVLPQGHTQTHLGLLYVLRDWQGGGLQDWGPCPKL
jgi:hypothetical protein